MNYSSNETFDRNEFISNLNDISKIIDADMDKKTLIVLMELLEAGVHPGALIDGKDKVMLLLMQIFLQ